MYQSIYAEMAAQTTQSIRENERLAFERSVELLQLAQAKGRGSIESVKALLFVSQLWGVLMEDLAHPENGLPDVLKADLISIGIWMLRRAEDIRQGRTGDFAAMIEVSKMIGNGLRGA